VSEPWVVALLAATAAHAGFQATVTLLVYPALARVAAADFASTHAFHSRRITPLVAIVYGALLVSGAGAALSSPDSAGVWVAVLGAAGALLLTATGAAPTHGRLGTGRTERLVERLLVLDRLRLGCGLIALAGAVVAASG
jgi:hypothetical protein